MAPDALVVCPVADFVEENRIVVGRSGAVGIDVADVGWGKPCCGQGLLHGEESAFSILRGGRLVVGIAGVAPAREHGQDVCTAAAGGGFAFEYHKSSPFSQIESGTMGIERSAGLAVENHQRVETIDMEARQALAAAHHHAVETAAADEVSAEDEGVGRRGTGGAAGGDETEVAEVAGGLFGHCRTIAEVGDFAFHRIKPLHDIHTTHRSARHERCGGEVGRGESGLCQRFAQC